MKRIIITSVVIFVIFGAVAPSLGETVVLVERRELEEQIIPAEVLSQLELLEDPASDFDSKTFEQVLNKHGLLLKGQVRERLLRNLDSEYVEVLLRAAQVIQRHGRGTGDRERAISAVAGLLYDEQEAVRVRAVRTLWAMKDRRCYDALIGAVDNDSATVRRLAIEALGDMKVTRAAEAIVRHLDDMPEGQDTTKSPAAAGLRVIGEWYNGAGLKDYTRKVCEGVMNVVEDESIGPLAAETLGKITRLDYGNDIESWKWWWAVQNTGGREFVVRLYRNWGAGDEEYEIVRIRANQYMVRFDNLELEDESLIVLGECEQKDETVKEALTGFIGAWLYRERKSFGIFSVSDGGTRREYITFKDALGVAMVGARVNLYLRKYDSGHRYKLCQTQLDEQGRLPLTSCNVGRFSLDYGIKHPDWADGFEAGAPFERDMGERTVPMVRSDSKFAKRSIWGRVVDSNGSPIAGAQILNTLVSSRTGSHIRTEDCTFYTNSEGWFYYYPIVKKSVLGTEVPRAGKYAVYVRAPAALDLLPFSGDINNGVENTITLKRGDVFKNVTFEDANGPITDQEKLKRIALYHVGDENEYLTIENACRKDGTYLPFGKYKANGHWGREHYEFDTVELTVDSPDVLVFRPKQPPSEAPDDMVTYFGRVVDGLTGNPMGGVFVTTADWTKGDLAEINDVQWEKIYALGPEPDPNDEALIPVRRLWSYYGGAPEPHIPPFKVLQRTDENGAYALTLKRSEHIEFVVALAKGYIMDKIRVDSSDREPRYKPDEDNMVELPDMRMYRSGKLKFEPMINITKRLGILIGPDFKVTDDVPWSEEFLEWYRARRFRLVERRVERKGPFVMQVPAGINLRLAFKMAEHGRPGDSSRCTLYTDYFKVEAGETLDIGQFEVPDEMPVYVQVVDSVGEPVDGVSVRNLEAERNWSQGLGHITDSNGFAMFYVPPEFKGRFSVCVGRVDPETGKWSVTIREGVAYEVRGREDANSVFTLQLSDEMIEQLFK